MTALVRNLAEARLALDRLVEAEAALARVRAYIDEAEAWGDPLHSDVIRDLLEEKPA